MRSLLGRFHRPFARSADEQLLLMNNLGDGSTLSLDFTTGVLDPRLTFTRSTSGTYIGSDGLVKTASTNVARFDYDPTTLAPRGLLIEGSANNLLFYSQDVTQATKWTIQGSPSSYSSISATGGTAPDNTNTANLCTEATGSYSRSIYQSVSPVAGTYTVSVWAKAGTGSARFIRLVLSSAAGNFVYVTVNIANGAVTQSATAVGTATAASATVTQYTGSWYKISLTGTLAAAANFIFIVPTDSGTASVNTADYGRYTYTGDGSSFNIWGAQLEAGSGASSYIPTGASTGSRAYDHCYATGANFTSWFSVGAGTMVVVSDNIKNNTQNLAATISDDSTSNYVRMGFKVGGAANEYLLTTVGGPSSFQGAADSGYAPPLNTVYRMAYAWDANNFGIVANGGTVATDLSGTLAGAGVLNRLVVGGDFVTTPNDIYFKNGHIRSLKYWPTRLANAQLQALTT